MILLQESQKQCMHVTKEMDIPQFACSYTAAPFFITELPFLICVNVELTHSPAPYNFLSRYSKNTIYTVEPLHNGHLGDRRKWSL